MARNFTRIFNDKEGKLMRKGGVKLTTSISYIEPCKLRDKTIQNAKEIDCTKVFFGDNFIVLEMTILDFLKESEPQISYL